MSALLQVRGLEIHARGEDGESIPLVEDFSLSVRAGERVALVGESGSGKTVSARAVMRLDPDLKVGGTILLAGEDLTALSEKQMTHVRGQRIGMVFQDPMGALNPLMTIGDQVAEPLRAHGVSARAARAQALDVLRELGVDDAERRMRAYPHEFSGGMRQRVVMAIALVAQPALLIADEPTTALDVRVQAQVLDVLTSVTAARNVGVLLITHDVGVVAGFADRVAVMYAGRIVESGPVTDVFASPAHPYTRGLLGAVPRLDGVDERLTTLPGTPPNPARRPPGCAFAPRCPSSMDICAQQTPRTVAIDEERTLACHLYPGGDA